MVLSGCSAWERKENYLAAKETSPLQIPAGLDEPNTQAQLVIPAAQSSDAAASAEPPKLSASAATMTAASRVVERDGKWQLALAQPPSEVFPLVATALERGGYPILARDDKQFSYQVRAAKNGMAVEGGGVRRFFKRLTFSDAGRPVNVIISPNAASGSVLSVAAPKGDIGGSELAQTLLEQLAERLK